MRIGELSQKLGVNASAIRFYERQGLISKPISRTGNGYRAYSQKDFEEIRQILKFKEFGLELNEIKDLLSGNSKSCGDLVSSLDDQIEKCREMESFIKQRISSLVAAKESCQSVCGTKKKVRKCCA